MQFALRVMEQEAEDGGEESAQAVEEQLQQQLRVNLVLR